MMTKITGQAEQEEQLRYSSLKIVTIFDWRI